MPRLWIVSLELEIERGCFEDISSSKYCYTSSDHFRAFIARKRPVSVDSTTYVLACFDLLNYCFVLSYISYALLLSSTAVPCSVAKGCSAL